ncbi:hypothetical protein DPMN_134863 [Dreissena polymorpha]|uniref:Uncharacterized protein n=1 Tax=Dreissena polymorpha TaxID=45954 RepID=A0A9D4JCA3_DREPO|nr:hypothetical protein DPMN_134863 [Dreissena polymorpha]
MQDHISASVQRDTPASTAKLPLDRFGRLAEMLRPVNTVASLQPLDRVVWRLLDMLRPVNTVASLQAAWWELLFR